jgi:3-oxoacyl-[acyl-carrier-protein] synthase III
VRTYVESLGSYLPEHVVSTADVVAGCRLLPAFPLERLTGIAHRRRAAPDEYTVDLAVAAARDCLAGAPDGPPVDLVLACHISRVVGPPPRLGLEPALAHEIAARVGLAGVAAYDVSNACAGTFTGLLLADLLIRAGTHRRVLVVSGEYVTHLADTAQREVTGPADPRLAALTLGDAAVAALVAATDRDDVGFRVLDLRTRPEHCELCVARPSDEPAGGFVMYTDAARLAAVSIEEGTRHVRGWLDRLGLRPEDMDHFLLHQTSRLSLDGAVRHVNAEYGREAVRAERVLNNLRDRGNTASTTHLLAWDEGVKAGRIRPGDRLLFSVTGSGLTVGTAVYQQPPAGFRAAAPPVAAEPRGVAIHGLTASTAEPVGFDSAAAGAAAVDAALAAAGVSPATVDLLVHAGVYRTDLVYEPAVAALVGGRLGTLADPLCFDLADGAVGFLRACQVAVAAIGSGDRDVAVVTTSEVDNNAHRGVGEPLRIATGSAAVVLAPASTNEGFEGFGFFSTPDAGRWHAGADPFAGFVVDRAVAWNAAVEAVRKAADGLVGDARWVVSPFPDSEWSESCRVALGVPAERWFAMSMMDGVTLTVPLALATLAGRCAPGDLVVLLAAGSGVSAGAARYRF